MRENHTATLNHLDQLRKRTFDILLKEQKLYIDPFYKNVEPFGVALCSKVIARIDYEIKKLRNSIPPT
jgi:hypothetical protein